MVDGDGGQQDQALDDVLPVRRDIQQDQGTGDDREQGKTQHGAQDRAGAAFQAGAADHHGSDHVQFHSQAEGGRGGAEACGVDHARQPRECRAQHGDPELHAACADA
ncbi:hypothetical protein G6F23_015726 [Rhizopus arrhizus]|nr:hypothetical protein G6F23_015726 [Rhizopus arrhizus]